MTFREVLGALGAANPGIPAETPVTGISTDSRTIREGQLFIPLSGESFDGHRFVGQSIDKGAAAALSSTGVPDGVAPERVVYVPDTLAAYQAVAAYYRRKFPIEIVAITGSNGKTTTKEITAALLSTMFATLKSEENFNNEVGVPLTLLRIGPEHQRGVIELAMRGRDQIRALTRLVNPQVGLITNIGEAHFELLGSYEAIADAKGELLEEMSSDSTAVLNRDCRWFSHLLRKVRGEVVTFGISKPADVCITVMESRGKDGSYIRGRAFGKSWETTLPLMGYHNHYNFLGALASAMVLGFELGHIEEALGRLPRQDKRMEFIDAPGGFSIINDAYNASPASMKAAVTALADLFTEGKKIAVLGDMLELGAIAESSHSCIGKLVGTLNIDCLVTVGERAALIAKAAAESGMPGESIATCRNNDEAWEKVRALVAPGDIVLFKASRRMRLEEIVNRLLEKPAVGSTV